MKTSVPDKHGSIWIVGCCLLLTILIGMTRYLTGPELAFSLFYLLPITLATKQSGYRSGILISISSAVTWLLADLSMAPLYRNGSIPFVNAASRLVVFLIVTRTIWALQMAVEEQRVLAHSDPLTKAANRRAFFEASERALKLARRFGYPLSVLYLDLDHFKEVNDRHGHHAGDELLCIVTQCVRRHIREIDLLARMGGDEFCVLLIDSPPASAIKIARELKAQISASMNQYQWPVAVSIGAATFISIPDTVLEMVSFCDELMYSAKNDPGANIVHRVVAGPATDVIPPCRSAGSNSNADSCEMPTNLTTASKRACG